MPPVGYSQAYILNPGFEPRKKDFQNEYTSVQHLTRAYSRGCKSCLNSWWTNKGFADLNNTFLDRPPKNHPVIVFGESFGVITASGFDPEGRSRLLNPRSTYLETRLKIPILKGKRYLVSFQVALSRNLSNSSVNKLGIYFSPEIVKLDTILMFTPQIETEWVVDTSGEYILVQDTFIATNDFNYLTIGYFPSSKRDINKFLYRIPDLDGVSINLSEYNKHPSARFLIDEISIIEIPETQIMQKIIESQINIRNIQFEEGKATLTDKGIHEIEKLSTILIEFPFVKIILEGHTDDIGNNQDNMILSKERTKAIKYFLYGKGISLNRIQTTSHGETKPLVPNINEENRLDNRRVEIKVIR